MASLLAQADAIRAAVTSVATCNPTISATLKELLQDKEDDTNSLPKPTAKSRSRTAQAPSRTKPAPQTKRGATKTTTEKRPIQNEELTDGGLGPKEKAMLATQVINATLKALGEAAKAPQPAASANPRSPTKNELVKAATRKALRRSQSMPMTPLQPRSLNRVSTSPATTKPCRSPSILAASAGCLATVECARAAFQTLRTLQSSGAVVLPDLQLETGMTSFISKLIALNLYEHAAKELRILKRRLENAVSKIDEKKNASANTNTDSSAVSKNLSDLLYYPSVPPPGPLLGFIISAQQQALRILLGLKKTIHLESALPFLQRSTESSPLNLILLSLKDPKHDKSKCVRQLESLSQMLLSLTPSLAAKDDGVAQEPRLSPSPATSLKAQCLGLSVRLQSWDVRDRKGDVDKEILMPFSKCMGAFWRRCSPEDCSPLFACFDEIWEGIEKLDLKPSTSSGSPLAAMYQTLASASRESGNIKEAKKWTTSLKNLTNEKEDSPAKCCAITAQLLALSLKESPDIDQDLLRQVLDGLQGPLSGSVTELDDLLVNINVLRKAAMGSISSRSGVATKVPQAIREMLETFIFHLPRFALRWLGKPPASDSATKDFLRFEQRRQLLGKQLQQLLDSALMLAKQLLDDDRLAWDLTDTLLHDCLSLLDAMGDIALPSTKNNPAASYHVKISHLYYQQFLSLRSSTSKQAETTSLRALRRSVDTVKQRPEPEQTKAQLLAKWERFGELCKASGRKDDAADALRSLRDHLVREEVVSSITSKLATHPVAQSWKLSQEAEILTRTVCNLAKLDRNPNDWTWLLTGMDKVTALEHDFHFIIMNDSRYNRELDSSNPTFQALLRSYAVDTHPIRRVRTLLQLQMVNLENPDRSLQVDIDSALGIIESTNFGNDAGLARYAPHLRALSICIVGLVDRDLDSPVLREAISVWKAIAAASTTAEQLSQHIDNIPQLLNCLQSLSDLARTRGLSSLLTEVLELTSIISRLADQANIDSRVSQSTALCLHYIHLGRSSQAEKTLLGSGDLALLPDLSEEVLVNFHLSAAEYHLAVGALDKVERHLVEARAAAVDTSSDQPLRKSKSSVRKIAIAHASAITARLALDRGNSHDALKHGRTAVKLLFHDWSRLEELRSSNSDVTMTDVSRADTSGDDSSLSNSRIAKSDQTRALTGPSFWTLVYPLYRFLTQLSSTYAHLGLYQETVYYAEQAQKVAKSMAASAYIAQSGAWLASILHTAGKSEQAAELVAEVKTTLLASEATYHNVEALCRLASVYQEGDDAQCSTEVLGRAESMLELFNSGRSNPRVGDKTTLEQGMERLSINEKKPVKVSVRVAKATKPANNTTKAVPKKPTVRRTKVPAEAQQVVQEEDVQASFLRAAIIQHQSASLLENKDWGAATAALRRAFELSKLPTDRSHQQFLLGMGLVGQSLEMMESHSVFSFIQDSTLSFPSVAGPPKEKLSPDRTVTKVSPPLRKGRAAQDNQAFIDMLKEAQEHLLEAHAIASLNGDGNLVHRVSTVLQNVVILLSNTNTSKAVLGHPAHATCSIELARNLVWRRERKTLRDDSAKETKASWPTVTGHVDVRRSSLGCALDVSRFQRDYVDIIPKTWSVVSLSLSDDKKDLCITKLQAGHSPFALRVPLERAISRDADNEVFSFEQGRAELLDIIEVANRTCHDARDMSRKEAKSAWWAEREELDERLKELLENIEQTWLGGFRGILSQQHKRSDLLTKFSKSLQQVLDRHLPSRQPAKGKRAKTAPKPKVNLDPRILDLFIGLGDASVPQCELDEQLTDLLYFVVDILQFHGEINAYDEINFEQMIVETFDALHAYHDAAKSQQQGTDDDRLHTILILDKPLHVFPWESLPCLQGAAVSRAPSLACLRRAILEQRPPRGHLSNTTTTTTDDQPQTPSHGEGDAAAAAEELGDALPRHREGHYASIHSGTYILNPSADLANTQATFARPLAAGLPPAWDAIETRAPGEAEFERALAGRDLLLYFGHGSGAQYVRGRTVRRLPKCRAAALLLGCSSAKLLDAGAFEPSGPVWNYMHAGAPAVLGTLWDVTDRDIDRFAAALFEEWGLLPRGTFKEEEKGGGRGGKGKGNGKGKGKEKERMLPEERERETSLIEAVAKAREACRFRYLTAAAAVVYGIPVYIDK
ncbi:peptidase family C50-domain-containing protein [Xylariomycetidae sp. FL0641]|nr:peptidase family C50-domain-containing protein [Xylariomycetidae sp. FL0641]